jgi:hypothetical protein
MRVRGSPSLFSQDVGHIGSTRQDQEVRWPNENY